MNFALQAASSVHGHNQWPHHSPAFEAVLRQYITGCLHIGQAVMRGQLLYMGLYMSRKHLCSPWTLSAPVCEGSKRSLQPLEPPDAK